MKENNYPGKFIAFEGLDGSGSSTQAELLVEYLKSSKGERKVQFTQEPTDSLIGGLIRSQLRGDWEASTECLQLLFCADRAHHLEKQIIPWLKEGITTVADRYFFSTIAYGSTEIEDYDWLEELNVPFVVPDLTVLIEVSPEACLERIKNARPHFELYEEKKTLTKVSESYRRLKEEYDNVVSINGEKTKQQVLEEVKEVVDSKLEL